MANAAQIAASLSEAQRRWLPEFTEEPQSWFNPAMSKRTRKRLAEIGLTEELTVTERGFPFPMTGYRLTPLGAQVRAILRAQSQEPSDG